MTVEGTDKGVEYIIFDDGETLVFGIDEESDMVGSVELHWS